jgi:hypothetical protein
MVVVGPFEDEEEGIGVTSDVVKVKGEDQVTPGSLRMKRVRWPVCDNGANKRSPGWLYIRLMNKFINSLTNQER